MTHRVIWEDVDGSIKQTIPSPQFLRDNPNFDLNNLPGVSPAAVRKQVVADADAPTNRTFRNAWKWDNRFTHKCGVDMTKAKAIAADKVREARVPVMAALDVEYIKADEAGNPAQKTAVITKKNAARDATQDPRLTNATTPDELEEALAAVVVDLNALV